jgi:excisionase family DNA binding protein
MRKRTLNYVGYGNPYPVMPVHPISVRIPVAVQLIGVSRSRIYELIRDGEIETVKIGTTTLIPMDSLERLIASRRSGNAVLENQAG